MEIQQIDETALDDLVEISQKTYVDKFGHTTSPENLQEYLERAMSPEALAKELTNPESFFYMLYQDQKPIAYIKLNIKGAQSEPDYPEALELQRIYVLDGHQGLGIGEKLMNFAIDQARNLEAPFIWLGAWEQNEGAMRFYQRHGFEVFSSHDFIMGDDVQTDLLLRKYL